MARLLYGWLTAFFAGMPLWLGYAIADSLTEVHYQFFPGRRHHVLANLAVILPRATRRERVQACKRIMRSYNRMMFEFFRLPHVDRRELMEGVEVVGREHFEEAIARGRGVILCTSHIGNWELAAVVFAHWGYTMYAVAGVQLGRWLAGAVRDTKSEYSIHTVSPEDGFRKLWRALESNHLVALLVDGDVYSHGIPVPFFGREMRWPAGPGVLAQRTGALILTGVCRRVRPGRFQLCIEPPIDPAAYPTTSAVNEAIAAASERHIRADLDQWCIFRSLWEPAAQPEGVPSGAAEQARA